MTTVEETTFEEKPGTRERLVAAMSRALQRRGLHGIGLNELLEQAQAPKGVLYHHFPGGKTALAVAAIETSVARLCDSLGKLRAAQADPVEGLRAWLGSAQKQLRGSGFDAGCPLATVALESTAEDLELRQALAAAFAVMRERLGLWLTDAGVARERAHGMATLIVAAYEGALIQARVAGSTTPMSDTTDLLLEMLQNEIHPRHPKNPGKARR